MTLTREQILKVEDLPKETVEVPEWGGAVIVATLSGTERDRFEATIVTADGKANLHNMRAKLAAACIVDDKGQRLFGPADIDLLGAKSASALDRVVVIAQRLNRLGDRQLEDIKGN